MSCGEAATVAASAPDQGGQRVTAYACAAHSLGVIGRLLGRIGLPQDVDVRISTLPALEHDQAAAQHCGQVSVTSADGPEVTP